MNDNKNNNDNRPKESTLTPPPVPPPTPPPTKNPSSLLSPWWSAEPLPERKRPNDTRRSLIRFTRIVQGDGHSSSEPLFTERCYMLTKSKRQRSSSSDSNHDVIPSDENDDCRQIKFIILESIPRTLVGGGNNSSAVFGAQCGADYYTVDLGERWNRSGEDAQRIATIALTPLQHLTQRYIQSWQDGTQAAFLSRFWDSAKRGDAFHLMLDNAKKLLHHATTKKEEDTAKKDTK
ncbi:hypothetical protein K492DRAFT_210999 [Lichtheimia hyalospora FSU 10163]|nr:hypothetical protein K492DRAFT_210999 [Lichtheimia hyalospora FSU 10163]